ncbi:hypothetical protein HS088_TW01G00391 [Tripterygium wilfordii]|uniref:BHLH domain-containing protein n=1 Tax=Tripterygium wilfordii TaxID=458696 RepID=A0A7J7E1F9_TRIWF|nr:transcription factor FAMA-like [Tripterygium wilfordii]KAF5752480.1 hypothetical protein HS088_TW01G00391 [Tripterygium wilfordii]
MEKEEKYQASFMGSLDYSLDHHHHHQNNLIKPRIGETSGENNDDNNSGMIDYMLNQPHDQQQIYSSGFCTPSNSLDKLSFADVMQFADFGSKLGVNHQNKVSSEEEETAMIDPVCFLKFPVLNEKEEDPSSLMVPHPQSVIGEMINGERLIQGLNINGHDDMEGGEDAKEMNDEARVSNPEKNTINPLPVEVKNKRKRPRSIKTSEEVESQRMTHIAVERNRRKQMNEHLRVLRSLMPGSYVQRGDQASIIGGAIEFVRELEQLLQCLESQKRRRIYGEAATPRHMVASGDTSQLANIQQQPQTPFLPPMPLTNQVNEEAMNFEIGLREEKAESKSCLADVEVKVLGFDAIIKILSRRRPGQLVKTIAALEDLQLSILHTNITTIEQTVLYSFNVKVTSESRFTAEDIASSVQHIFSFIHANTSIG